MQYEVEQKHRVDDFAALEVQLRKRRVTPGTPQLQVDTYFSHPNRDFAGTDEALRIRQLAERNFVTYKGPKLDATTKTRRELELPLPAGKETARQFAELLEVLGFQRVAEVRKARRSFTLESGDREVTCALDDVNGLGTFLELEITTDDAHLEASRLAVAKLAGELSLGAGLRESYLEMQLANNAE